LGGIFRYNFVKNKSQMNIIFFMIAISLIMATGFLIAFLWANNDGQNDDLHTPGMRILLDEKLKPNK
jgi:cbb3-type cytochrome oxidase maturation protein